MPPSLTLTQTSQIRNGVHTILNSWYVYKSAVDQGWGGQETQEKSVWFVDTITTYVIDCGRKLDIDDLSFILEDILCEEFQVMIEDQSSFDIAEAVRELYIKTVRPGGDKSMSQPTAGVVGELILSEMFDDLVLNEAHAGGESMGFCADKDDGFVDEPTVPSVDPDGFIHVGKRKSKKRTKMN